MDIQSYYNHKLKGTKPDYKDKQSASSIKKHNVIIRGALQEALKKNMIAYNPADRATLPKQEKTFTGSFYTVEQANDLLSVLDGEPLKPAITITLFYGLRRSELLGLEWGAIDFQRGTIEIRKTVVRVNTVVEKERTKNKASHRTLPLIPEVKAALEELRREQVENKRLMGRDYHKSDKVFVWPNGRPFGPDYISQRFPKILEKHGLQRIRFHDLRHTTASMLIAKGFSLKEIQDWLGHTDISTTANIYGHLEYKAKLNIANGMGDILNITSGKQRGNGGNKIVLDEVLDERER